MISKRILPTFQFRPKSFLSLTSAWNISGNIPMNSPHGKPLKSGSLARSNDGNDHPLYTSSPIDRIKASALLFSTTPGRRR